MSKCTVVSAAALFIGLASTSAQAGMASLTLFNGNGGGGEFNTTRFDLTNLSAPGVNLTGFSISIGDTQYLFDQLYLSEEAFTNGNGTQSANLLVGDRSDDNVGPDLFRYALTNVSPGVIFSGQWDIDNDNLDFNADTRRVFFNNGAAPNAVVSLTFSDGSLASYEFSDFPDQISYTIEIPTPTASGLLLAGGWVLGSRRRRSQ